MAGGNTGSLNSSEALELWWAGRETWNAWVEAHSNDDISFVGVDFSKYRDHPKIGEKNWPFLGFLFPRKTDFSDVNFGDGDVCFAHTRFNAEHLAEGFVDFSGARFGAGKLSFHKASFHAGEVDFGGCYFGDGQLFFDKAEFAAAKICFDYSTFGNGNKFFTGVNVHSDELTFIKAEFGDGLVDFESAIFEADFVSFQGASFGDGDVSFSNCVDSGSRQLFLEVNFGKGDVSFRGARFGTTVDFGRVSLGAGQYDFQGAWFSGRADFGDLKDAGKPEKFSFKYCRFEGAFSLSALEPFECVPDFVGTATSHHFSLEGFECNFPSIRPLKVLPSKAKSKGDAERFRRLKELATQNQDFSRALDFNVGEIKSSRWHTKHWQWKLITEALFELSCNYGRSVWQPLGLLVVIWVGFTSIYNLTALELSPRSADWSLIVDSAALSFSQMYGYLPGNGEARVALVKNIFRTSEPWWFFFVANSQSVLTIILTFLLGLTLRNRFKM